MRDLDEGLDSQGFIVTGVDRGRIPASFEPILRDIVEGVDDDVSVYVYGSVATGRARLGRSDVDVVALGMDPARARLLARDLTARYATLARDVAIGAWTADDLAEGDAGHGNCVFLKHYCAWLAGPDPAASMPSFRGDVAAARGFNGDLPAVVVRWIEALGSLDSGAQGSVDGLARRIGRKSLFAVASMVSVHDAIWTTDRAAASARWGQLHPELAADLELLLAWGDETASPSRAEVDRMLHTRIPTLVDQFVALIGAWDQGA